LSVFPDREIPVYRDIPEEMRALIEPIVAEHGLELVDIERTQGRAPWNVRVVVDTARGDGRVPVDVCAEVSRHVGAGLDASDLMPVRYNLEVSSPGLDRLLAREKDFAAACGKVVKLETRTPLAGRRRFRGRLVAFGRGVATLEVDGVPVEIPFADVARARTVYEFTREDFARPRPRDRELSR
jgi:ribosome maturation factor RimP